MRNSSNAEVMTCVSTENTICTSVPDKVLISISVMPNFAPNPMFGCLLESSCRDDSNKWYNIGFSKERTQGQDDSNKWSNIGFSKEITQVVSIQV